MSDATSINSAWDRRRWLTLGVIGIAQLMIVLDVTVMNIALPSAQRALGFTTSDRQWVVTAYTLAFGSLLLPGGRLADVKALSRVRDKLTNRWRRIDYRNLGAEELGAIAAARRIAKRVAAVREHNPEPTLESLRTVLRDVIARCIYGVDLNPMAVELAKVSLWLEVLDPGKPLSFLGAHVKCGNALIGVTPKLIDDGILDAAFKPAEADDPVWGDDKKFAASLCRANEVAAPGL